MAKGKDRKEVMREASLERRSSDVDLSYDQLKQLSLFARLKSKMDLEKFPGTLVLRRYRQDEVVFRQGEAGWTAFYILNTEDVVKIKEFQLSATQNPNDRQRLMGEIVRLRERAKYLENLPEDDPERQVATVKLATLRDTARQRQPSGLGRLLNFKKRPFDIIEKPGKTRVYIPVDGPVTMSWDSQSAPLLEGELFGEMSCIYRTPRSATVVANRDCYMLEMLRNILDKIQKDANFKKQSDATYKKRVFELQLRNLSIFKDLTNEEFNEVRDGVDLVSFEPGQLICDEHERADSMYIVRSGLVKVLKNASHLFSTNELPGLSDFDDWPAFAESLRKSASTPDTPQGKFWNLLSDYARSLLTKEPDFKKMQTAARMGVIHALNDVIRNNKDGRTKALDETVPEFKKITDLAQFKEKLQNLPEKRSDWTESDLRLLNRELIEYLFPKGLRPHRKHAGPELILTYLSRGDFFGEMGLMNKAPRSATCLAYGHPNDEGMVELVHIPGRVFLQIMKKNPKIEAAVKQEIASRRKRSVEALTNPAWDEANQVQFSERFGELGLIQGQKLMLIDLDRCTRCDECVRACVNSHEDGRSRLFLDGPRFGKYLVPTACRSCLDPVCMIRCPVGSIHRGDNREIIIEDWCIGCEICSKDCPYGSIQMHDLGIIPENSRHWRFLPLSALKPRDRDQWFQPGFRDDSWLSGSGPFIYNRDLKTLVNLATPSDASESSLLEPAVAFRHPFELTRQQLRQGTLFSLELTSMWSGPRVWLNGTLLKPEDEKPKQGKQEFALPTAKEREDGKKALKDFLRVGRNVLAVQVSVSPARRIVVKSKGIDDEGPDTLLSLRMDEIHTVEVPEEAGKRVEGGVAEEVVEKKVMYRAVVCDLCSSLPGKEPACVNACPHDAAMRVNARFQFPTG